MNRARIIFLLLGSVALAPGALLASQSPVDAARSLFDAGRYADAQTLLNADLSKSTNQAVLYYWLARSSFELKQNDQAVKNAERRTLNSERSRSDPPKFRLFVGHGTFGVKSSALSVPLFLKRAAHCSSGRRAGPQRPDHP